MFKFYNAIRRKLLTKIQPMHVDGLVYDCSNSTSMGLCKKDVTPLLTHWSYVFLALTHGYLTVELSLSRVVPVMWQPCMCSFSLPLQGRVLPAVCRRVPGWPAACPHQNTGRCLHGSHRQDCSDVKEIWQQQADMGGHNQNYSNGTTGMKYEKFIYKYFMYLFSGKIPEIS